MTRFFFAAAAVLQVFTSPSDGLKLKLKPSIPPFGNGFLTLRHAVGKLGHAVTDRIKYRMQKAAEKPFAKETDNVSGLPKKLTTKQKREERIRLAIQLESNVKFFMNRILYLRKLCKKNNLKAKYNEAFALFSDENVKAALGAEKSFPEYLSVDLLQGLETIGSRNFIDIQVIEHNYKLIPTIVLPDAYIYSAKFRTFYKEVKKFIEEANTTLATSEDILRNFLYEAAASLNIPLDQRPASEDLGKSEVEKMEKVFKEPYEEVWNEVEKIKALKYLMKRFDDEMEKRERVLKGEGTYA